MAATGEARTHTMRAQVELRRQILSAELAGGTRLYEVAVAERLEISRTPVREAMARLVEEGLLERGPKGGFVVRIFDHDDVRDTIELRGLIEGMAARYAAERGADQETLREIYATLRDIDACFQGDVFDFEGYSSGNMRFHQLLGRLSGSVTVERELERIIRLPFASPSAFLPFRFQAVDFRRDLVIGQHEHHCLVEAIAMRQGTRAEAIAREHIRPALENFNRIFSGDREGPADHPSLALISSDGDG